MNTRLLYALALACAVVTTACSDEFGPTAPVSAPPALSLQAEDSGLMLVKGQLSAHVREASVVIGPEGGTVTLWGDSGPVHSHRPSHSLTVPPRAVSRPTRFVIALGVGDEIEVDLSATDVRTGRPITRFKRPLSLSLSYAGAPDGDASGLKIVYLVGTQVMEIVTSRVDTDRRVVIGELTHFSRYAVACE